LERLQKANLFIIPLDQQRQWYRYHPLFAELLRKQLNQEMPEMVSELHLRASRWYEANELLEQAFQHVCMSGDRSRVLWLVNKYTESLWKAGELDIVSRWIDNLTQDQLELYPELWIGKAFILSDRGEYQKAEELLNEVRQIMLHRRETSSVTQGPSEKDPFHHPDHILGLTFAGFAHVASLKQQPELVIQNAQEALQRMRKFQIPWDIPWECDVLISLSHAHWQIGDSVAAIQDLTEAIHLSRSYGHHLLLLSAVVDQALMVWLQGQSDPAEQICQEGLAYVKEHKLERLPITAGLFVIWGLILYEQGELEEADSFLQQGFTLSQKGNDYAIQCFAALALAHLLAMKGDRSRPDHSTESCSPV
jgi:LuxR family maltose regulon positive regulatory protein